MFARSILVLPFLCIACTVRDWRELRTAPMPLGECYDGLDYIATKDGFVDDPSVSDRGFGIWQSRWRPRVVERGFPARYRLRAEVLVDEGTAATGWPIRFAVDQEKVKDLRRATQPREEDWSADGQDKEREAILGDKLMRRLAPKAVSPASSSPRAQ